MREPPREPTSEECSRNSEIRWMEHGRECVGFACWYPQMGGYGAHCVIEPLGPNVRVPEPSDPADQCFDAFIWHDGEFPIGGPDAPSPAVLHHCLAQQFIDFGQTVNAKMRSKVRKP